MPSNDSAGAPEMIRGSVVVHRRRCGKRTAGTGDMRSGLVLSYSERGRTRFVMLPPAQVAAVAAAVDRIGLAEAELAAAGEAGRDGAHWAAGRPAGPAVTGPAAAGVDERFAASRALFETTLSFLDGLGHLTNSIQHLPAQTGQLRRTGSDPRIYPRRAQKAQRGLSQMVRSDRTRPTTRRPYDCAGSAETATPSSIHGYP